MSKHMGEILNLPSLMRSSQVEGEENMREKNRRLQAMWLV